MTGCTGKDGWIGIGATWRSPGTLGNIRALAHYHDLSTRTGKAACVTQIKLTPQPSTHWDGTIISGSDPGSPGAALLASALLLTTTLLTAALLYTNLLTGALLPTALCGLLAHLLLRMVEGDFWVSPNSIPAGYPTGNTGPGRKPQ